jgi:ABC-type molybdate transport system permease subunit
MNWPAIILSLKLSSIVCALLLLIGMPVAYWVAFSKWRWKFLVESVVALPLVLPPTVLGLYPHGHRIAKSPRTSLGGMVRSRTGVYVWRFGYRIRSLQSAFRHSTDGICIFAS